MNYAAVLKSSLIPEKEKSTATKAKESKAARANQKSKATKVLELLKNKRSMTQRDIAKVVGCHEVYVAQVKKAKMKADQQPRYERHVSEAGEFEPSDEPIIYTSNLYSLSDASQGDLREITVEERAEHILSIQDELEGAKSTKPGDGDGCSPPASLRAAYAAAAAGDRDAAAGDRDPAAAAAAAAAAGDRDADRDLPGSPRISLESLALAPSARSGFEGPSAGGGSGGGGGASRSFSDDGSAGDGDSCSPPASPRAADAAAAGANDSDAGSGD